jgi:hypothetical protein
LWGYSIIEIEREVIWLDLSDDEIEAMLDAIDLNLQGADDTKRQLTTDRYLTELEDLLMVTADHNNMVERLQRCRQKLEEERDKRRGKAHAA